MKTEPYLVKKVAMTNLSCPLRKKTKTDLYVSPGNSLMRKMVEPLGENELDDKSLQNLWLKACKGDEHCPRYTELAIANDPN